MSKIGRNSPCPCGSGMKHKNCCGKSNVVAFDPLFITKELEILESKLVDFSIENYQEDLMGMTIELLNEFLLGDSSEEHGIFINLITPWLIFHEEIDFNRTIFDIFYDKNVGKIKNGKVKQIFSTWKKAKSSIFEVKTVVHGSENEVEVYELQEEEKYTVMYDGAEELEEGDFLVGTVIPYDKKYRFFMANITLDADMIRHVVDLLIEFEDLDLDIMLDYPLFLSELIQPIGDDLEWLSPSHERVAQQFAYHMDQKDVDESVIYAGILFWNQYSHAHFPSVQKTSTYAAALDYFIHQELIGDYSVTQTALAKEYGVSSGTISNHYQKFLDEFEKQVMEIAARGLLSSEDDE